MKILNFSSRAVALALAASLAIPAWTQNAATTSYAIKGGKVFTFAGTGN